MERGGERTEVVAGREGAGLVAQDLASTREPSELSRHTQYLEMDCGAAGPECCLIGVAICDVVTWS